MVTRGSGSTKKKTKLGPDAERLKIEIDPQEALRRLLTKPPPPKESDKEDERAGDGK